MARNLLIAQLTDFSQCYQEQICPFAEYKCALGRILTDFWH